MITSRLKKLTAAGLVLLLTVTLTACDKGRDNSDNSNNNTGGNQTASREITIDLDLVEMGHELAHAESANVFENPHEYIGKVFRIRGVFESTHWEEEDYYFHDIVLDGSDDYPAKYYEIFLVPGRNGETLPYPEEGEYVELIGTFEIYEYAEHDLPRLVVTEYTVLSNE